MTFIFIYVLILSQKYQRNMTLRNENEDGDAKSPEHPEPSVARRGPRKRRHEEVRFFLQQLIDQPETNGTVTKFN